MVNNGETMKKIGSALFAAGIFWALSLSGCIMDAEPEEEITLQGVYKPPILQVEDSSLSYRVVLQMTLEGGNYEQIESYYYKTHPAHTGEWNALVYIRRSTGTFTVEDSLISWYQLSTGALSDYDSAALSPIDVDSIKMKSLPAYAGISRFRNLTKTSVEMGNLDGTSWSTWVKP